MDTTVLIFVLILLIFCLGVFSASETALFSLSSMKVKAFKHESDKRKRLVASLLSNPKDLLITIIMLNIIMSILIQNVVSSIFGEYSTWLLTVGVPLGLTLVFGEVIPKSIGLANNEKISYRVAPWLDLVKRALLPIRRIMDSITNIVSRCLFFFLRKQEDISIDELQHTLKTSKQYGVLQADEADLVNGFLSLHESTVKELMRPREEVLYFDIEDPMSKLVHLFVDQECTRIPVCDKSLDNVLGIMSSRLFFLHKESLHTTKDLKPILKKAFFVPESTMAHLLLRQLYERRESLAIVVDEYSSISGIISLEDLVEVVVGEIADRRDEKSTFTRAGEDVIIASGKLELSQFEEIFGQELLSENNLVTIGGWLTEQLGDIPKAGAKYVSEDFLFHVLAADPTRVRRVYIRRLKKPSTKKKTS